MFSNRPALLMPATNSPYWWRLAMRANVSLTPRQYMSTRNTPTATVPSGNARLTNTWPMPSSKRESVCKHSRIGAVAARVSRWASPRFFSLTNC